MISARPWALLVEDEPTTCDTLVGLLGCSGLWVRSVALIEMLHSSMEKLPLRLAHSA